MDCLFETGNLLHRIVPVSGVKIYNPLVWFVIPCLYVNVIHQSGIRSSEHYYERNAGKLLNFIRNIFPLTQHYWKYS